MAGWFGPSGTCGCCTPACDCADAWPDALALYSALSFEINGPGLTYILSTSTTLPFAGPGVCSAGIDLLECESYVLGSTGLRYRLAGPASCSIPRFNTAAELGLWKATATNRFQAATCNGSSISTPPGIRSGYGGRVTFGASCIGGTIYWGLTLSLTYAVEGSEGCNPGESYRITDPVTQGYTPVPTGSLTRWEKANGSYRTSVMTTVLVGNEDRFCVNSDWYSTTELYEFSSPVLTDIPTSLTISPFYNPAGATASFSLT